MRIPTLPGQVPNLRPVDSSPQNLNFESGDRALNAGVAGLSKGIEQGNEALQKAAHEANVAKVVEGLAIGERDGNQAFYGDPERDQANRAASSEMGPALSGAPADQPWLTREFDSGLAAPSDAPSQYLATKGEDAVSKGVATMQWLEKRYADISQNVLVNDEQRKLFAEHSTRALESYRQKVESHTLTQVERAKADNLKALESAKLLSVSNDPKNDELASDSEAAMAGPAHALSTSPEVAAQAMNEFGARLGAARIGSLLKSNDWAKAKEVFEAQKSRMQPQMREALSKDIEAYTDNAKSESIAVESIGAATGPDGRVSEQAALDNVDKLTEGEGKEQLRKDARLRARERAAVAERAWDRDTQDITGAAITDYAKHGWAGMNPGMKQLLSERNGAAYLALQEKAEAKANRGPQPEHETRAMREALTAFRVDMVEHPAAYSSMTLNEFTAKWGNALSGSGFAEAGKEFAKNKKEDQSSAQEFSRYVADELGQSELAKQTPSNKVRAGHFTAFMGRQRRDYIEENKKPPTLVELKAMRDKAWEWSIVPGLIWDSKVRRFDAEAEASQKQQTPTAARVKGQAPAPTPAAKFEAIGPNGERAMVNEKWLAGPRGKGWRRASE